jgi:hypothetical protein
MPNTYSLISSNTLSASAASVTFSAIPNSFTDLTVRMNTKYLSGTSNSTIGYFKINSTSGSLYSITNIGALNGNFTVTSSRTTNANEIQSFPNIGSATANANVFSQWEIYIPSYTASQNKPTFGISFTEQNNLTGFDLTQPHAGLWRSTAAITSLTFFPGSGDFVAGSSFQLYGIKNS